MAGAVPAWNCPVGSDSVDFLPLAYRPRLRTNLKPANKNGAQSTHTTTTCRCIAGKSPKILPAINKNGLQLLTTGGRWYSATTFCQGLLPCKSFTQFIDGLGNEL